MVINHTTISGISTNPALVIAHVTTIITAIISNATYVYLGYHNDLQDELGRKFSPVRAEHEYYHLII